MHPDKNLIKLRFEKAAATYEQQALVQQLVADRLLELLASITPPPLPVNALEIGCCTGLLTAKTIAAFPTLENLTVSDLVAAFEPCVRTKTEHLGRRVTFLAGDIEAVDLRDEYDLIISSSTFHWIHDLRRLLRKLKEHLAPGGIFAFSLYGADNLSEIRDITGMGLQYMDLSELKEIVATEFSILTAEQTREELWFADALSVLQHLRETGVNAVGKPRWTRAEISRFINDYQSRYSDGMGVKLTYHPMFIIAEPGKVW